MTHLLEDFHHFLSHSPTAMHAAVEMGNRLASLDFIPLLLEEPWHLEKGKKYFVTHGGALAAFVLPFEKPEKMSLLLSHTDSPTLKLKPQPEIANHNMKLLGVEAYGSPILSSWFNRDLAIAGKMVVKKNSKDIEEKLVFFEDTPIFIPLIAPHLDREGYKKGVEFNIQEHMTPLAALQDEPLDERYLESLLQREFSFQKLLHFDLFLVPLEEPRFIGSNGEMLSSYRLDNLSSAHAALIALGNTAPLERTLPIGIFWDHEEIGSSTSSGAASSFFKDVYTRLFALYKMTAEEESILRHKSLAISADVGHALNPNYEKKYDPHHLPLLGKGIVIKHNAQMRYSTTARGAAKVSQLCDSLNLPYQQFVNRSDNPSGSTVGPIFSTKLGIETVDLGVAQLSMHAAREVLACRDQIDLSTLLTEFLKQ